MANNQRRRNIKAEILKELKPKKRDRRKISLYLSEKLYRDFQTACADRPASRVIEILMERFIAGGND